MFKYKYITTFILHFMHKLFLTKRSRKYLAIRREIKDFDRSFRKSIKLYSAVSDSISDFVDSYKSKSVRAVRLIKRDIPQSEPILLCIVKNDIVRLHTQIEYHKKIGIKHFAYIDNMSNDGTYEWLNAQEDISLFTVEEDFSGCKKVAWLKQAMDILGHNRWYLVLDQDEFFCYPGIEKISIDRYIEHMENERMRTIMAPMLDMYKRETTFSPDKSDNFMDEYCYFDTDTLSLTERYENVSITGGSRVRALEGEVKVQLGKYPLFKACKATIMFAHTIYPLPSHIEKGGSGAAAFLLHYKFVMADIQRFRDEVESGVLPGNGINNTMFLQAYEKNSDVSFFYEGSQKLNSSMDLLKVSISDKRFFEKLLSSFQ